MTMQNTAKPTTFSSENLHGLEVDFIGDQNIILLQPYDSGSIDEGLAVLYRKQVVEQRPHGKYPLLIALESGIPLFNLKKLQCSRW